MKRQFCKVKHDPENGTYGDCLRACVATVLGHDAPHFFHDGCDGEIAQQRLREYLETQHLLPVFYSIPGDTDYKLLLHFMSEQNPGVKYLLFCRCGGEDHVVICQDDSVIFNPAWAPHPVSGPSGSGVWVIMTFAAAL